MTDPGDHAATGHDSSHDPLEDAADLDVLVHRADLDGLVRLLDARGAAHDWAGVLEARDRARAALSSGRQLWPVATLAEYRLALWAPPEWAARVLDDESGRFTIGPLTEVAAQRHTFADLAPHVHEPHRLGLLAHERALRGEAIPPSTPDPFEIPFDRQPWEPTYALATYSDDGIDDPPPATPVTYDAAAVPLPHDAEVLDDDLVESAVRQLFDTWTAASNGRVDVCCVEGSAAHAVGALGVPSARLVTLPAADALAWLSWAGATGAAQGRRRGAASGRFAAWWLLAALGDLVDDWPPHPDELGEVAQRLRWWWWDAGEPSLGWAVHLAVEDPDEGIAWAVSAHDAR
ncbi:MAG: hypothetical protein ACO3C1_10665 [Ilumatobacteraceae bacterium]